jgi:flagellar motor protein MotB
MELTDSQLQRRAAYRRQLHEEAERRKKAGGFKNGAQALQAFRDLFDSDEEMEEFGNYLQQMREEERARYRD